MATEFEERGIEAVLISEGLAILLRLFLPVLKNEAEKTENRYDDFFVKILETVVKQ